MENRATLYRMVALFKQLFDLLADLFRSRAALEAEILVLRQQIVVLHRGKPRGLPRFCAFCCEPIDSDYLREFGTRIIYCGAECFELHVAAAATS